MAAKRLENFFRIMEYGMGQVSDLAQCICADERLGIPKDLSGANGLPEGTIWKSLRTRYLIPAVFTNIYEQIIGCPISSDGRDILVLIGAISRIYDDMFDIKDVIPRSDLERLLDDPLSYAPTKDSERLLVKWYSELVLRLPPDSCPRFYERLKELNATQFESLEQESRTDSELVDAITKKKGGIAVLMMGLGLEPKMDERRVEALYALGGWLQMSMDLFDEGIDRKSGVNTLPVVYTRKGKFMARLNQQLECSKELLKETTGERFEGLSLRLHIMNCLFSGYNNYLEQERAVKTRNMMTQGINAIKAVWYCIDSALNYNSLSE